MNNYIDLTPDKCISIDSRHILIKHKSDDSYYQGRPINAIETTLVEIIIDLHKSAEAAEARAAELLKRLEDAQVYIGKLEAERDTVRVQLDFEMAHSEKMMKERDGYKTANEMLADTVIELRADNDRLTLERDNALAERDRANAGFAALRKEYDRAMTRLAAHGEKVTA